MSQSSAAAAARCPADESSEPRVVACNEWEPGRPFVATQEFLITYWLGHDHRAPRCSECGEPIRKGEIIIWPRQGRGGRNTGTGTNPAGLKHFGCAGSGEIKTGPTWREMRVQWQKR